NCLDAISCTICSSNSSFTWVTPSNSSGVHPLGYLFVDDFDMGSATLTVPANAVVKTLNGGIHAVVNTSGTGAVFTSLTDNSVGIHACPSVLVATCTPKPGDWSGIDDIENAHLGQPFAVINGATFRYAAIAVDVEFAGGGSSAAGSDATLSNVNIAHGYGGVAGVNASVAIAGGTITDMTTNPNPTTQSSPPPPQFWGPAGYGVMVRGTLSIKGTTVSAVDAAGISARGNNVTISGNTVAQAARSLPAIGPDRGAIEVFGDATTMTPATTVTSNTVTTAGSSSSPAFAIQLSYVNGDLGAMLAGNTGAQNWSDSVWIPFSIDTHRLTWVSAVNSASQHPLGYVGDVEVRGAVTVTVPANAVVKGMIALKGASLDATAGGASFDIFNDNSVGAPTCFGQYTTCGQMVNNNFIIDAQANGSTPASVAIDSATMRLGGIHAAGDSLSVHDVQVNEASPAITASAAPAISVVGSHFTNGGTPVAVQDSSIQLPQDFAGNTGYGNSADEVLLDNDVDTTNFAWAAAYNSTTDHPLYYAVMDNLTVDDATMTLPQNSTFTDDTGGSLIFRGGELDAQAGGVTFDGTGCASICGFGGIQLESSTVSSKPAANAVLDGVTITHATAAIQTSGAASASMTCSLLTKNLQGAVSGGNGITISQSTLPGQLNGPDVAASVLTYAQNDWWGQPAAPRAGQTSGPVVTQPALLGPPACAPTSAPASAALASPSMTKHGATAAQGYDAAFVEAAPRVNGAGLLRRTQVLAGKLIR
ncbi:MAG: hypothetical protein JOZ46_06725, partial [Candidatus Dormibacteraeota bacterium]|nr:hypothetical protein [Candidatus Dormibacteraeota bacterium]